MVSSAYAAEGSYANATKLEVPMAKTDDAADEPESDEMLPDEREAIAERLDSLDAEERLSVAEVAEQLGIDLEE